jgi:hypothetical protein
MAREHGCVSATARVHLAIWSASVYVCRLAGATLDIFLNNRKYALKTLGCATSGSARPEMRWLGQSVPCSRLCASLSKLGGQISTTDHLRDEHLPQVFDARACQTRMNSHFVNVDVT